MAQRIYVRFPADRPWDYYHRVLNFAEALYGPVIKGGLGALSDLDHASDTVWVDVFAKRQLGVVKALVKKALKRAHLDGDASLTVE